MNTWTRIGLVLLRLVIGWHFLFEGLEKLDSWYHGPREGKPEWSAEGYLRESQGPLAPWFRAQVVDPDADAQKQLTQDAPDKLPAVVADQWQKQFDAFVNHYELGSAKALQPEHVGYLALSPIAPPSPLAAVPWPALARTAAANDKAEKTQLALAKEDFALAQERAVKWFTKGERQVPSKIPKVTEKVKETTPQRLALYRKKLDQLQEIETKGMPAFDRDVWKENLRTLKKDIEKLRTELLEDLHQPFKETISVAGARLSSAQVKRGPVPPPAAVVHANVESINFVTLWGLTIVGACLILGLLTRTACVAGAAFLLMFFLAMPSLEWLPINPRAEGHYLWINKNIIEMIALLTLATTQSGKWVGFDGLIQYLNPFRRRGARPADTSAIPAKAA